MKWENWLIQLESTPADDAAWDSFDAFSIAATQIAASKRYQRESARNALEEILLALREQEGTALSRLGWPDLSPWQSAACSSSQALRLVTPLNQLRELLERLDDATRQVPATPQQFQMLRRTRNSLEDEILQIGSTLDAFFADPQAENALGTAPGTAPEIAPAPPVENASLPVAISSNGISSQPLHPVDFAANGAVEPPAPSESYESFPIEVVEPTETVDSETVDSETVDSETVETAENKAPVVPAVPLQPLQVQPLPPEPVAPEPPVLEPGAVEDIQPETVEAETVEAETVEAETEWIPFEFLELEAPVVEFLTFEPSQNGHVTLPEAQESEEFEVEEEEMAALAPVEPPLESSIEPSKVQNADPVTERVVLAPPPQLAVPELASDVVEGELVAPLAVTTRRLRIFISSPGDVGQERVVAMRVVDRLQNEFAAYVDLEPILWEHEPLRATGHFQEQILAPSLSDIVVCILWSRLGTRLPEQFQRADGSLYASGTEWEFEDALNSYKERGTPDLMVYRKSAEPHASMSDEAALLDRLAQKRALDSFIDRWFGNPQESFKAAFHQFQSPDEFEQVLESHLRKLVSERLPEHVTEEGATGPISWHKGSPFRGLEAFDPEHAPVFFGRTKAISEVGGHLVSQAAQGSAFVVVFGMSGSGKSSLVKAGLLPTLTQPGVVEGVGLWRYALTFPSETRDPIFGLASALLQVSALPELHAQGLDATELAGLLREAPQRAIGPLRAALKTTAESTAKQENLHQIPLARLAIVVDQLEEIWTQEGLEPEERRRFIAVLQVLAKSGIVWVMATMRSDFFVRCAEIPELMQLKEGLGQYHLLPPTFAELSQILTQPARSAGLRFEVDPQTGERLSDILQDAAGKDPGALPLLEFTLDELFQKRTPQGVLTFAAYQELGGIEGALGRRAEEVFVGLPLEVQNELPSVLRALVTVSEEGGNEVHVAARRAPLSQLAQNPARRQLVEAFVAARLLVSDGLENVPENTVENKDERENAALGVVRVAHEALLRHWPRLQKWLADDLDFLRTRARVMNSAAQWSEASRLPEYLLRQGRPLSEAEELLLKRQAELEPATIRYIQESRRVVRRSRNLRLGVVTGVIVTFLAVVTGFGAFSFSQWKKTEAQKKLAMTAVNKWTYDVPGKLAGIPATRPALKTIFQENIQLLSDIEALDPQTSGVKREKAANLDRMGDTWALLGDSGQAKNSYEQSLAILTSLEQSESTPDRKRDLATSLEKIGDTRQLAGDYLGAKKAFGDSLALRSELSSLTPSAAIERELSVSYEKMGGLQRTLKDFAGCRANLQKAWQIRSQLAANKQDTQAQRDLFVCAVGIGDAYLDEGNTGAARQSFERILPLTRERAKGGKAEAQRDLAALYDRLGDVQVNENKGPQALVFYKKSLAISQDLARNQDDAQAQRDLLTSWERIGQIQVSSGDARGALLSFGKALPLAQNLARDRDNLEAQQSLLDNYLEIGDVQLQMGGLLFAHAAYQRALRQYQQIIGSWPRDAHSRAQAASAYGQLAYLNLQFRRPAEAVAAATQGLNLAPKESWIAVNLVEATVFSGQLAKAQTFCLQNKALKVGDVSFKQALLTDLQQLEKGGLTHPDMVKLRQWLVTN